MTALGVAASVVLPYLLGAFVPLDRAQTREAGAIRTIGVPLLRAAVGAASVALADLAAGLAPELLWIPAGAVAVGAVAPPLGKTRPPAAAAAGGGTAVYILVRTSVAGALSPATCLVAAAVSALALAAARRLYVAVMAGSLFAALQTAVEAGFGRLAVSPFSTAAALLVFSSAMLIRERTFRFPENVEVKMWRIAARPFAMLFLPIDLAAGRRTLLLIAGIVALVFIVTDLVRIGVKFRISAVYKQMEAGRFSSMTMFLVSVFLVFLLFPSTIPYVCLACMTFGDFAAKVFGMVFGKTRLYGSRTVEGSVSFLAGSLLFTYVLSYLVPISLLFVMVGCAIAATVELFSEHIDDNFTVGIVTGGVLTALRFFLSV